MELYEEQLSDTIDILSKNAEKMTIMITDEKANILVSTDDMYGGAILDEEVHTVIGGLKGELLYTDMGIMDQKYGVYISPMRYTGGTS